MKVKLSKHVRNGAVQQISIGHLYDFSSHQGILMIRLYTFCSVLVFTLHTMWRRKNLKKGTKTILAATKLDRFFFFINHCPDNHHYYCHFYFKRAQ
jgi:hypothetical protein